MSLDKFKFKDLDKMSIEELTFAFHQNEKLLEDTNSTFNSNSSKSNFIIGLCVTFSIGLIGYSTSTITQGLTILNLSAILLSLYFVVISIYLSFNLKNDLWDHLGSLSSELIDKSHYDNKKSDKSYNVEKGMIFSELISYDERASSNMLINSQRSKRINKSIIAFLLSPVISLLFIGLSALCLSC